jgi:hypothetical protein
MEKGIEILLKDCIVGERYSPSLRSNWNYCFIVTSKNEEFMQITWGDGLLGMFSSEDFGRTFFAQPHTPLEKALL